MLVWKNLSYCEKILNLSFLKKQAKFLKITRKGILFLSKTHPKHNKHNSITVPKVLAATIESDEHKSMDLFGGILIFHIYVLLEVIWKPCITND